MEALKLEFDLGFTHINQKNKSGKMTLLGAYAPNEIELKDYKDKRDIYYTPNTFNSPRKRIKENLWQLHRLYIDIDYVEGKRAIDQFEVVGAVEKLVKDKKIPEPTEYINSGRGIHVYWDIEHCHIMLLDLWDKLEKYIYSQLKEIEKEIDNVEIDVRATDATRLLRLPGTINSKNNSKCYSMLKRDKNIYNIFDLKKAYIKAKKPYKKQEGKIRYLPTKNFYTLNKSRLEDFKAIVSLRNNDVEGYRNTLIMYYSYHYRLINEVTVKELIEEVKSFNESFKKPYSIRELTSVCRSVNRTVKHFREDNRKGYKFRNKYIIESLDLTLEEQKQLATIISTKEKYRRNNERRTPRNEEGLTPREQKKQEVINKVQELKLQGLKQKEVAEKLNKSIRTIKGYWNI